MPEASVLDYLKALLNPRQKDLPEIPPLPKKGKKVRVVSPAKAKKQSKPSVPAIGKGSWEKIPWRLVSSFLLFLLAQKMWASPDGAIFSGLALAIISSGLLIWAYRLGELRIPELALGKRTKTTFILSPIYLFIAFVSFAFAFFLFRGNQFNFGNVFFWFLSIGALLLSIWNFENVSKKINDWRKQVVDKNWNFSISGPTIIVLVALAMIAFFRFAQLDTVPIEMVSDHAEKLFDVIDIQNGNSPIYFERNTGREPLQFYLSAWIAKWLGTGISFLTLKLGTTLLGFLSLYYVYQLGKDYGGRWVGMMALLLTGLAYWPNVLARTGLRFILYPAIVAPTLLYLLRAFNGKGSNNFLKAGFFLGLGLLGYTAFRVVPFIALVALIIFWLHRSNRPHRKQILLGFTFLILVAIFVFTPVARYAFEENSLFNYRVNSRLFTSEVPYPENPIAIFIKNTGNALAMPFSNAGSIWLVGLIQRPALDIFSGALYFIGIIVIFLRYLKNKDWRDIFLLLSVPMLMLPSILSLAFPAENPALNRAGGATVAIFIIAAIGLDAFVHGIKDRVGKTGGLPVAWITGVLLIVAIGGTNYDMLFRQYGNAYQGYSWNSSEIGEVIENFSNTFGDADNAWVIAYPHWVDTRLVGINAGNEGRDFAIWADQLPDTQGIQEAKLFIFNLQDADAFDALQNIYPQGSNTFHESKVEGKDFYVYFVPASVRE